MGNNNLVAITPMQRENLLRFRTEAHKVADLLATLKKDKAAQKVPHKGLPAAEGVWRSLDREANALDEQDAIALTMTPQKLRWVHKAIQNSGRACALLDLMKQAGIPACAIDTWSSLRSAVAALHDLPPGKWGGKEFDPTDDE